MTRFFVRPSQIDASNNTAFLDGADAEHCYVLRLRNGEVVTLCDGLRSDYQCEIVTLERGYVSLRIDAARRSAGEPRTEYRLYCALPKGDKAEHIIQKATELGAKSIEFFPSANCVAKYDSATAAKKLERWRKIAREAAQQSQRGIVPEVNIFASYGEALSRAAEAEMKIFCYERAQGLTLAPLLHYNVVSVAVVTGSEGGFTDEEARYADELGFRTVSLGSRILRCETAPLAVLSAFMLSADERSC